MHAQKLERWLGAAEVEHLSQRMANWYGPPIAIANVPGAVFATKGGDFVGPLAGGGFASLADYVEQKVTRACVRVNRLNTGFNSLSDLIAEGKGKRQYTSFQKDGGGQVNARAVQSLWRKGTMPVDGGAASAAPGGTVHGRADAGSLYWRDPDGTDTAWLLGGEWSQNNTYGAGGNFPMGSILLYDRLFAVAKTPASSTAEAVTGVPTRYQSTTPGDQDSADGNFHFIEQGGTVAASGADHEGQYTNSVGGTGKSFPTAGNNFSINRPTNSTGFSENNQWHSILANGDIGLKALTSIKWASASQTQTTDWVIGHPLAWFPSVTGSYISFALEGVSSAFRLVRVFANACLAMMHMSFQGSIQVTGNFTIVSG